MTDVVQKVFVLFNTDFDPDDYELGAHYFGVYSTLEKAQNAAAQNVAESWGGAEIVWNGMSGTLYYDGVEGTEDMDEQELNSVTEAGAYVIQETQVE